MTCYFLIESVVVISVTIITSFNFFLFSLVIPSDRSSRLDLIDAILSVVQRWDF